MGVIPPWAMDRIVSGDTDSGYTPEYAGLDLRRIFAAFLSAGDSPLSARPGVLSGADVSVVGGVVYVSPCLVVVGAEDGSSFVTGLNSEEAIDLAAPHATNPRVDRLVVQINHTSTERSAEVTVLTGEPAPSPQAPDTPSSAESLGTIDVPADGGGSAVFNDGRRYTTGRGGIINVPNSAALSRVSEGTGQEAAFASVDGALQMSTGDGWSPVGGGGLLLDEVSFDGNNRQPPVRLVVPQELVGKFRSFKILVKAGIPLADAAINSLIIRPNGDSDTVYTNITEARRGGDILDEHSWTNGAFPRTGFLGEWEGMLEIVYYPRGEADAATGMFWATHGWGRGSGEDHFIVSGGGAWVPSSSQSIEFFHLLNDSPDRVWNNNSSAQLWGYR